MENEPVKQVVLNKGKYTYQETPDGVECLCLGEPHKTPAQVSEAEVMAFHEILELQRRLDDPFAKVWEFMEANKNIDMCSKILEIKAKNPGRQEEIVLTFIASLLESNMSIRAEWAKRIVNQSNIIQPKEKRLII